MDWFKKNIVGAREGKVAQVYYYLLACSKPHYDEYGNFIDMRTSEEDTGKISEICNKQKKKNTPAQKGVLSIDIRTYSKVIQDLTNPTLDKKEGLNENPQLLIPLHNEVKNLKEIKGPGAATIKSKAQTEFVINRLDNTPGFQFSKIDKDLLKVLSKFKNPYIISVLAHLLWFESATKHASEQTGKQIAAPYCVEFILNAFGMKKYSNPQWYGIRDALLLLQGMGVVISKPSRLNGRPVRELIKINNFVPTIENEEIDEDKVWAKINSDTMELELYSKKDDKDNNIKSFEELEEEMDKIFKDEDKDDLSIYDF